MAKRKKKKNPFKYKETIIRKLIKENRDEIVEGYFSSREMEIPAGKREQNKAVQAFRNDIKGIMKNPLNKELTPTELFKKVFNTEKFTSKEERLLENFYNVQKGFFNYEFTRTYINKKEGFEYQKTLIMPLYKRNQIEFDEELGLYRIKYGKDEGKYFIFVHAPGQEPSFKLELRDKEDVLDMIASGQQLMF